MNAIMLNILFAGEQADCFLTKLKNNIGNYFIAKNGKNSERNLGNHHIFYAARNAYRISDTGTSPFISFFSTTLSPQNGLFPEQLQTDC